MDGNQNLDCPESSAFAKSVPSEEFATVGKNGRWHPMRGPGRRAAVRLRTADLYAKGRNPEFSVILHLQDGR